MRRKKMSRRASKKNFRKGAGSKPINSRGRPMRGGFRI